MMRRFTFKGTRAQRWAKAVAALILGLGAIAGAILAVVELYDRVFSSESAPSQSDQAAIPMYDKHWAPIVYLEVDEFRDFLDTNAGKIVEINTAITFDAVLAINLLAHQACDYSAFFEAVRNAPEQVSSTPVGLMRLGPNFVDPQSAYRYDGDQKKYVFPDSATRNISCLDSIRLKMKDPSVLRFSHGGTGVTSLPIIGRFLIEKRYFSGPSVEYTLREIEPNASLTTH